MGGGGNKPINAYDYNYKQFKKEREEYKKRHEILNKLPQEKQDATIATIKTTYNIFFILLNIIIS